MLETKAVNYLKLKPRKTQNTRFTLPQTGLEEQNIGQEFPSGRRERDLVGGRTPE